MNKPLILVVEDDPAVARLISTTLETRNYQYHRVQNGAGALLEAASARPDVILLDLGLPDPQDSRVEQRAHSGGFGPQ